MTSRRFVFIRSVLFLAAVFVWNPTLSISQTAVQDNEQDKMRIIEFSDVRTKLALTALLKQLKLEVEFDESVRDSSLTLGRKDITIREFVDLVLEAKKLVAKMKDDKTVLIFADSPESRGRFEGLQSWSKKSAK